MQWPLARHTGSVQGSCCKPCVIAVRVAVQDPEVERADLQSAADQPLTELAASMGLTLAQLLGHEDPPATADDAPDKQGGGSPDGVSPDPPGGSPAGGSHERPGKLTRRMAAQQQAAEAAAKKAREEEPCTPESGKSLQESGAGGAGAQGAWVGGDAAADQPATAARKTRSAKRARSSRVASQGSLSPGEGAADDAPPGAEASAKHARTGSYSGAMAPGTKEGLPEDRSMRRAVNRGSHEGGHGNDHEEGGCAVATGVSAGADGEDGGEKSLEASEKEDAEAQASEVRYSPVPRLHVGPALAPTACTDRSVVALSMAHTA